MKKTISKKITVQISVLLLAALAIMFVLSYFTVSGIVINETKHYANAISSIYADMIAYESSGMNIPIDVDFSEPIKFYGDYISSWFRIDYTYVYIPDIENGTIQVLGFTQKDDKNKIPSDGIVGSTFEHKFSSDELALWNNETNYIYTKNGVVENSLETITLSPDSSSTKYFVGIGISLDEINISVGKEFQKVAFIIIAIFIAITLAMYIIIRLNVLRPTKRLCDAITDFVKNGRHSREKLNTSSNDEFAMIAEAFNSMTDDIDAYIESINELNREKDRQNTEIDIASKIQKGFLPPEKFTSENYDVSATMLPAKYVGGDMYDYIRLDDERTLVSIADVSGKGIAASMFMAVVLMLIRQYAKLGQSPSEILKSINDAISEKNPRMLFVTAFIGIYNSRTNVFTYSNAGHNLPYVLTDKCQRLDMAQNTLLGLFQNEEYSSAEVKLTPGDIIFLYTDGVNEATNEKKEFYGTERIEKSLTEFREDHEKDIIQYIRKSLNGFSGDAEQNDDITMLALTVKKRHELLLDVSAREFDKIKQVILECELPRPLKLNLCIAAEECFINICSYAYEDGVPDGEKIKFIFDISDRIVMQFTDGGVKYDPRENVITPDEYDIESQVGGLGKLIAFTIADSVDYEYSNGKNILTITKYIKGELK